MNHLELRQLLIQNKSFLKAIYEAESIKQKKSLLLNSSIDEVNILLHILFSITQGNIPIKRENFELLKKSKKLIFLHKQFENNAKFNKIMSATLKEKISLLMKFISVYSTLLFPLFHI